MSKLNWKPGTMIYPLPAVMVSCGSSPEEYNIITIAWTGTICTDPPMCYISVRPGRHSYEIIRRNGEFVINLTTKDLAFATDWCGIKSGKDFDKFAEMGLLLFAFKHKPFNFAFFGFSVHFKLWRIAGMSLSYQHLTWL